jgi:ribosomal protein L34
MAAGYSSAGYVQVPGRPEDCREICLTFNFNLRGGSQGVRREGFSLRMSTAGPTREHTEIGIQLTSEQWLDLIADMKREFEESEKLRKQMDGFAQ